jgi:hypothetical protein
MTVIVIRRDAKAAWLTGLASLRARASGVARRAIACAAAAVMVCALGAALLQLVDQMLSFPAPIAVTGITVMAAAVIKALRRQLRTGGSPTRPRKRVSPRPPLAVPKRGEHPPGTVMSPTSAKSVEYLWSRSS